MQHAGSSRSVSEIPESSFLSGAKGKSLVICGFPGIGKSYYHQTAQREFTTSDADVSSYSRTTIGRTKVPNPDFPLNYIEHIRNNAGVVDLIFVSTNWHVRSAMEANKIPYVLVFPEPAAEAEYLSLYESRGSRPDFIKMMRQTFKGSVENCRIDRTLNLKVQLPVGKFLGDWIAESTSVIRSQIPRTSNSCLKTNQSVVKPDNWIFVSSSAVSDCVVTTYVDPTTNEARILIHRSQTKQILHDQTICLDA